MSAKKTTSKKTTSKKTTTKKATTKKATQTPEEKEAAIVTKAEANLAEKYGDRIVQGTVRRAKGKAEQEKYGNKLLVTINTIGIDGKLDGKTMTVATSDVHQVKHQAEVKEALRKTQQEETKKEVASNK